MCLCSLELIFFASHCVKIARTEHIEGTTTPRRQSAGSAKHISSFRSRFRTCSLVRASEEHIIYVFILFSHNFIINVYHHYCSSFILHSSSCCQMKNSFFGVSRFFRFFFALAAFFYFFGKTNAKHVERNINLGHAKHNTSTAEEQRREKFCSSEDFHISKKDKLWYEKSFKRLFSKDAWTPFCRFHISRNCLFADYWFGIYRSISRLSLPLSYDTAH